MSAEFSEYVASPKHHSDTASLHVSARMIISFAIYLGVWFSPG